MKIEHSRQPLDDFFSVVFPMMANKLAVGTSKGPPSRKKAPKRVAGKR
jgi:hypothetical protein